MYAYIKNILFFSLALGFVSMRCGSKVENIVVGSPEGYNMKAVVQTKLPLELDEISGVAYYPPDSSLFAINDEKGWLYKLKKGHQSQRWKFSNGADFEDVVLLDSIFYVLQSNGNIIRLSFSSQNVLAVQQYYFDTSGESKNEFEILYFDSTKQKMILICKDCESDKKKSLTTFSFDPYSGKYDGSPFSINIDEIANSIGEKKLRFKPSAAAINPINGLLYIVSAINKMLVVTDVNGKLNSAY
ncbi:MAG: SdiA-regulated domain-containing protein, partial [Chitinophagaceae bacterium]